MTAEAGPDLGLPADIPAAAGAADTAAAALGSGVGAGDIQLTVGTGAQVIRPLAAPVSRAEAGINLYRLATPDGWYQMGATLSAGLSLNWVRETMNATWAELYASADHPAGHTTRSSCRTWRENGHRTSIRPCADPGRGCRCLPTGNRSCGPRWRAPRSRSGTRWTPCSPDQRPPGLRLAGGGTLPAGGRQLLADVLGLPLYAVDVPAASGRGAALLGARTASSAQL